MSTSTGSGNFKRPRWVWVIFGFYLLSVGWTLLSFALVFSGAIPMNAAQQEYFASLGVLDYISSIGVGLISIWAAVLLFRLRKSAAPAFGLALALNTGLTLVHLLTKNWAEALGGSGLVGAFLGWVTLGCVFLYTRRLRRRGLLA
ncbi:MAG: hypothetical protein HY695_21385 [Deltaproteobacteria bacterium]|nr:hypothetical protein [Deltaproteobacteria bacterium]